jgi:NAD(P)-dependent dehydrogenase (short-subunit alcohol dehydrogenase family)
VISFESRTAIVTGAGNGIGLVTAHTLAGLGAAIGVLDRDGDAARAAVAALVAGGARAHAVQGDVASSREVGAAVEELVEHLGAPHVVVNNAGVSPLGPVEAITQEALLAAMAINVGGTLNVVTAALPHLRANGGGRIVNVASWLGVRSRANFGLYCATKAALISLTRTMALEFAADGIAVNAVLPGAIADTPMRRIADADARAAGLPRAADRVGTIPLGRLGTPEDVARTIAFAASDAAQYMTGDTVGVDGGIGAAVV